MKKYSFKFSSLKDCLKYLEEIEVDQVLELLLSRLFEKPDYKFLKNKTFLFIKASAL